MKLAQPKRPADSDGFIIVRKTRKGKGQKEVKGTAASQILVGDAAPPRTAQLFVGRLDPAQHLRQLLCTPTFYWVSPSRPKWRKYQLCGPISLQRIRGSGTPGLSEPDDAGGQVASPCVGEKILCAKGGAGWSEMWSTVL